MKKLFIVLILIILTGFFVSAQEVYDVTKPDSSSKWDKNSTYPIKWNKKGDTVNKVKIRLFNVSGTTKILNITNDTDNDGEYPWKIPSDVAVGHYTVLVKNVEDSKWGLSDVFEIKSGLQFGISKDVIKKIKKKPKFKPTPGMFNPVIEEYLTVPLMKPLRPSTKLILKGEKFGNNKGKILIKGNFPGGQFELENVEWTSDKRVHGYVPQSVNGQPNQSVEIVLVTSLNFKSKPEKNIAFEGREEKILTADAVGVNCGTDGNDNICNGYSNCESTFVVGCSNEYAICGWHQNNWGASGNDVGDDVYYINLQNGWVLKSMEKVVWEKSSGDEVLSGPSPSFPAGQSSWNAVIHWKVTPNDSVRYNIKIIVEGPIGTHYK